MSQMDELERRLLEKMGTVAENSAERGVRDTLLLFGIDVRDPIKAQTDFAVLREVGKMAMSPDFRKDLEHLRKWRLRVESITAKSVSVVTGAIVILVLSILGLGFQQMLSKKMIKDTLGEFRHEEVIRHAPARLLSGLDGF